MGSACYTTMVKKAAATPLLLWYEDLLAIISFSKSLFYLASQKKISLQQFSILTW